LKRIEHQPAKDMAMKMIFNQAAPLLMGGLLNLAAIPALAGDGGSKAIFVTGGGGGGGRTTERQLQLSTQCPVENPGTREASWLGVGVEESSEALSAQLNLKPGEGLTVTFVATNSPAAGVGLRKNDVLVELDGQMLVDPEQLRKLVQMHAYGDAMKIDYYRASKKQTVSVKLAKHAFEKTPLDEIINSDPFFSQFFQKPPDTDGLDNGKLLEFQRRMDQVQQALQQALTNNSFLQQSLKNLDTIAETDAKNGAAFEALQQALTLEEQAAQKTATQLVAIRKNAYEIEAAETIRKARAAREEAIERAVGDANAQQVKQERQAAQQELQQAAQQVLQDVLRQMPPSPELETIKKQLGDLANGGVSLDKRATVVVENDGGAIRTIVKKDSSGTYVIVADPAKHLTAHDVDDKLLFDGMIDSPEQQAKVPPEVWKKVEPMLVELDHDADNR
jgi:membrane-associated protease RseP (regulator of RpoE activity)